MSRTKVSPSKDKLVAKKSLGQNFLTSAVVPKWMCDAASVTAGDRIVEIGPGTGALTAILLERGATVVAIEADNRMLPILTERFAAALITGQLKLEHGDARTIVLGSLFDATKPYQVVANIPYYLSGLLLRLTLTSARPPQTLVFLLQKELVTRIARAKKSSLLALSVAVYGTPKYIKTVSRGHFTPAPKVDSAILAITGIDHHNLPTQARTDEFFNHLHLGFGQKRKQLLGNLAAVYARADLETVFTAHKLPLTIRAEDMGVETWLTLSTALSLLPTQSPLARRQSDSLIE